MSYYCQILLTKYACHIENIHHALLILFCQTDPTLAHKCAKRQLTATSTLQLITIYVSETNLPT